MTDWAGRIAEGVLATIAAILAAMNPWAATGAAFGCCFFLASPASTRGKQRVWLGLYSYGLGYGAGVFFYGGGPPFSEKAMLVAGLVSAFIAVVSTAYYHVVVNGGPLPAWAESILDRVPFLKRKGADDGA